MDFEKKKSPLVEVVCGQIVRSKAGRDKGRLFVIYNCDGEYIEVVDGDLRKLDSPKKKKLKHIQKSKTVVSDFEELKKDINFNDAMIRKILKSYSE